MPRRLLLLVLRLAMISGMSQACPPLPADMADAVRRAAALEDAAADRYQRRCARDATARLCAALHREGWTLHVIGEALGLTGWAIWARIRTVPAVEHHGLEITPAPLRDGHRAPPLPVEHRDWLTRREARELVGVTDGAITHWMHAGLLPRTLRTPDHHWRYYRGDLERILAAPRFGARGVIRAEVRRQIEQG